MKQEQISGETLLTSYQVGQLLQVNPSSVNKWVKDGRIPAFRTPGGHHRIRASDLITFLNGHNMPVPRPLVHAGRRRLLIADDDPKQLAGMRRLMKRYARWIDVRFVGNGIEALVQVGAFNPDVVVLDYVMPNLDGIEVCKRLKGMPETEHIKILLASARLTPKTEKKAIDSGATRCLNKPVEVEALLEELDVPEALAEQL